MSITLGLELKIRSMIFLAAEPIPYFWPMRTFIHHNPLHGLESLPFTEAVEEGAKLFHAQGYLTREQYQAYLSEGKVSVNKLESLVDEFIDKHTESLTFDVKSWLMGLLLKVKKRISSNDSLIGNQGVYAALHKGKSSPTKSQVTSDQLKSYLTKKLLGDRPVYQAVDDLYGTEITHELNELVIKTCQEFFDEGQSTWSMPQREDGFFQAWRHIVKRNIPCRLSRFGRGSFVTRVLSQSEKPEGVIAYVLNELKVDETHWLEYFKNELVQLHGWVGFIRWRSSAKHYHWSEKYPGDLVDFMAIRLTLALSLLNTRKLKSIAHTHDAIEDSIKNKTMEIYLRHELDTGQILPAMAYEVEQSLSRVKQKNIKTVGLKYLAKKQEYHSKRSANKLKALEKYVDNNKALADLSDNELQSLLQVIQKFENQEGVLWLSAMEDHAINQLLDPLVIPTETAESSRPFAQAMFCIDTRSERIRRQLENIGDYQTFGVAGFFGVPVSFMELGKGSESHLCPVILTPQNLVLEISALEEQSPSHLHTLTHILHDLKESVISPFVTVEAVGLLFGFDMVGKTIFPQFHNKLRKQFSHDNDAHTHLLLDKLSKEKAQSILRTVQHAVILTALEKEFQITLGKITDKSISDLRKLALDSNYEAKNLTNKLALAPEKLEDFIQRLRKTYQINDAFSKHQLEELGRIGFTLDEQTNYVSQVLNAIGLTDNFSQFVILAGHGSHSENNPYESALDCGACGGNQGIVSAKVLAQMANKRQVRRELRAQGITIPDDTWFVPAHHNTTTDELQLFALEQMPASHLMYLDRLRSGLMAASQLCAQERIPSLDKSSTRTEYSRQKAYSRAQRNSMDWSQVRPEWGLSGNAFFVIGRRQLTENTSLDGRAFLHSYDYRIDPKQRLLENILTGPLVVGQWINMEHYFSTVDNQRFGSGSKVNHNVVGRFGVMTGNVSDLRTGLPAQTVLMDGQPYHQPIRLITLIEAPIEHVKLALDAVITVKNLVRNAWIRLLVADPETRITYLFDKDEWHVQHECNLNVSNSQKNKEKS